MKKSYDFKKVDYAKIPKEIQDIVTVKPDKITKKAKLTFDGKQFIVRIPTEIAREMEIKSDDMIEFKAIIPTPKSKDEKELQIKWLKG